jgi:serine/threonine protein kinase/Tfp pilus assembly protein PilF
LIGEIILHYKILENLGEGGMGVVYLAEDTKLKRQVAIKFLPHNISANEEERKRFEIEAQAAAALNHPNIATIFAIEEVDNQMFIVMEYIDGKELKEIIESKHVGAENFQPLQRNDVINYAIQIAEGLEAAHKKGIIHRDIKSSNIMITDDGKVKIMDFGLAKVKGTSGLTQTGTTVGTIAYMSPEQSRGDEVDHRTDIWAFGIVLYEMILGKEPFRGDYDQAVIYSILNEEPEHISEIEPGLQQIIRKVLAKNPDDRYQSAGEIVKELYAINEGRRIKKNVKRTKSLWTISVIIFLLISAAIYLFVFPSKNVQRINAVKTIAVLPFLDLSPQKNQEYFSDGLSEELINTLSRNRKLRVIARTSSFYFKGKNEGIKTIAAKLNVKHILEGSVQKYGNNLRISADLVNTETNATLWANSYDGSLKNIFALQDSISGSVVKALDAALLGKEKIIPEQKTDPEAYNNYLLGHHFYELRGKENFEKAISYYRKALAIDSDYAPAWTGLAGVHISQADIGYLPADEGYNMGRREAKKAIKINPNLANAYVLLTWIRTYYDWNWSKADESIKKALKLDPENAGVINGAATLNFTLGRFNEASKLARRTIEIDPLRTVGYFDLAIISIFNNLPGESIPAAKKCLEINPQYPGGHQLIGFVYLIAGHPDSALAEMKKETEPSLKMQGLALVYYALGRKKEADEKLEEYIKEHQNDSAFQIAEIYAYRNEKDKAFKWLERAYSQHDGGLGDIVGDPLLHNIEKDPRYAEFMKKMKLPL